MSPLFISSLRRPPTPDVRPMPHGEGDEDIVPRRAGGSVWSRLSEHISSFPEPLLGERDYDDADSTHSSPPTPPPPLEPLTAEEIQELVRNVTYTSYISPGMDPRDPDSLPDLIPLNPPPSTSIDERTPSTQPHPTDLEYTSISPRGSLPLVNGTREWFMEQFICFMYRDNAIWLRVSAAMDEAPGALPVPYVSVRFVTELHGDDPALHRIGFVIERQLQDSMQREIQSAARQIVGLRLAENP